MERTIEQRFSIKFCVQLNKTATETLQMIQEAYGEDALSRTQVFQWHKNFREGRDDVHDKQRVGPPSTSHTDTNVQKVRDVLNSDRRLSIRAIADEVGIDKMTVHNIIKNDLGMRKICAKLVRRLPIRGSSITTMLRRTPACSSPSSWPNSRGQRCHSLLTARIWHHRTSFCSPRSRDTLRGRGSGLWKTFNVLRRGL